MKNKKIVLYILLSLFIITSIITIINFSKIYINKIKPINEKLEIYNNLKIKKDILNKKIKHEKKKTEIIEIDEKDKEEEKIELEKKLAEKNKNISGKVIYLTFDDGPSIYTEDILNTLDKYNVKATFFVTCSSNLEELSKKIKEKGHTLALHTCTHKYGYVYSSEDSYFEDLEHVSSLVKEYTGIDSKYIRFPGGSSNTVSRFNRGIMSRLTSLVGEKGYKYFDWNVDSNDAAGANSEQIYANVMNALDSEMSIYMVLMHDTKSSTKDALDRVIKDALDKGYIFSNINEYTKEVHHGVNN